MLMCTVNCVCDSHAEGTLCLHYTTLPPTMAKAVQNQNSEKFDELRE